MDINKHIIDQRIRKIVENHPEWFNNENNETKKLSKAFLILGIASALEMDLAEAYDCVTEGSGDAGVDGLFIGDLIDSEFSVVLIQNKYSFKLDKTVNFPDNAVLKMVNAIGTLFDPDKQVNLNDLIRPKVEEIRSLVMDGYIPNVKCIMLNNGKEWQEEGKKHISNANFPENQVVFTHYNHEDIARRLIATKPINDSISLYGKSIIEDFDFKRVLIGKISVLEIAQLMEKHGDLLLEKNIRKFLGVNKNRVNSSIKETLLSNDKRSNFYFFNNGITMLCNKFSHNALREENWQLKIDNLQIINGGQTSKTIFHVVQEHPEIDFSKTSVLLRLYELSEEDAAVSTLTTDITIATNSQTPVDLRDLRANDRRQESLRSAIEQLGYEYLTKKGTTSSSSSSKTIPSSVAAEAIFSTWKRKPQVAKYKKSELFGKYYDQVFDDVNGAQIIIAVLIFRYCDVQRKKGELLREYKHLPYSTYFMSMLCSFDMLHNLELSINDITHINFNNIEQFWIDNRESIYTRSLQKMNDALRNIFPEGIDDIDPRRLAATFRRGDLLLKLA